MSHYMTKTQHYVTVPGEFGGGSLRIVDCARLLLEITESVFDNDIVCIAGCGFGKVTHFVMEMLKDRDKRPKLYAFDTFGEAHTGSEYWEGHPQTTPWGEPFSDWSARIGGPSRLLDQFVFHLRNSPARDYLTDYAQFPWWTVAEEFKDDSVSWVVANGAHKPLGIRRELDKWWPKLKVGGKIALYGHDKADFETKLQTAVTFDRRYSAISACSLQWSENHLVLTKLSDFDPSAPFVLS